MMNVIQYFGYLRYELIFCSIETKFYYLSQSLILPLSHVDIYS